MRQDLANGHASIIRLAAMQKIAKDVRVLQRRRKMSEDELEELEEAKREMYKLDDNEDSLVYKWRM